MNDKEPTYDDLVRAWGAASECAGVGGSGAETLGELRRLRDLKTTWFGKEENDLRFALDRYLSERRA